MIRFIAITLLVACVPAYAAPVDIVAVGTLSQYDDPNDLLPFPQPDEFTSFVLTFTYDSETSDIDPDAKVGEYRGAISTISLKIGNDTIQSFSDNLVLVQDNRGNLTDGYTDYWIASTFDDGPLRSRFGLLLINVGGSAVTSDALVAPSWPFPPWGLGRINYAIWDESSPDPNNWVQVANASAMVDSLTVVPIPPTFWLLGTACLGVMGWMRRRPAANLVRMLDA